MEKVNSKLNRQAPNQVSINNFTYKSSDIPMLSN